MSSSRRPEYRAPPELFYSETEASKYTRNSRIIDIQISLSQRAIELLALPDDSSCLILDIGCGSGLSGNCIFEEGHVWIGLDISTAMLGIAKEREVEGDLILCDLGQGISFRPGTFDGAISISALQWLCNADKRTHNPIKRLYKFFSTLYAALARGSRSIFQFYPENSAQVEMILQQATKAGFTGGLVIDYPNSTKAKKIFLVLMIGGFQELPKALENEYFTENKKSKDDKKTKRGIKQKAIKKSRKWILEKKTKQKLKGKDVRHDSKYTARKRSGKFW